MRKRKKSNCDPTDSDDEGNSGDDDDEVSDDDAIGVTTSIDKGESQVIVSEIETGVGSNSSKGSATVQVNKNLGENKKISKI